MKDPAMADILASKADDVTPCTCLTGHCRRHPGGAVAVEEPREEIYRRLRLANDKTEAALDALEAALKVIRMMRGGDWA